jgi:hypothetical protein
MSINLDFFIIKTPSWISGFVQMLIVGAGLATTAGPAPKSHH